MAGRGPPPEPAHLRQRTNKTPGAAQLPTARLSLTNDVPELPEREADENGKPKTWHPMVVEWWSSVWRSPMASEFLDADMKGGLYLLASLHQARWEATSSADLVRLASEIRLQEVRFGLSPIDRSRLRWTIDQGETAEERIKARREGKKPKRSKAKDPRAVLKMVG